MVETEKRPLQTPLFKKRETLLSTLKSMTKADLQALYDSNPKIAEENHLRFQSFEESNLALYAYTGQQFKHLDAGSLSDDAKRWLNEHLFIMSGLYGLVRPFDGVGLYRLPMGVKWQGNPLKNLWKPLISDHLEGETVLNLASKEYSDAIDQKKVTLITVDFLVNKNGKLRKAPAMEAKKLRGKLVRKLALEQVEHAEAVKSLSVDDYYYDASRSDAQRIAFRK